MYNALIRKEWQRLWVHKTFKFEEQKGGPNNSEFLQNSSLPEIWSPLFNLQKFENPEESTPESSRLHFNLLNDEEFGPLKLLKLKYRRVGINNSDFLRNWFPPEITSYLFNL